MALDEREEFELLSLERERAAASKQGGSTFPVTARPRVFNEDLSAPARMTNVAAGTRQSPVDSPMQRFIYEAGGRATDRLANAGATPEMAAGVGYLTNLAGQVGSTFLGGNIGAKAEPLFQAAGRNLMQRALKPDKIARDSGKADTAIQTMLDEGINATKGGAEILQGKVDDLVVEVDRIIDRYPNARVDKQAVYDALSQAMAKTMKQGTPQTDMATIGKAMMDFAQHPLLQSSSTIPAKLAQELKQGVWRKLKDSSFGPNVMPAAERDAQKAIGSGLRQGIEDVIPEVGPANAKTQEFLNALKLVEARAGADGNKNLMGFGTLSPSMTNFVAWMLDRYPAGKSMLARYMYSHADPEMAGRAAGAATGAALGAPPKNQ